MEENFNVVAQSRANYYTPGSPVQFVRVEVLKGDQSGDHAICLTFKNIAPTAITGLLIHFKCKDVDGSILAEQDFHYKELNIQTGELFGMDDAVFISSDVISSADVVLDKVYSGKKVMSLNQIQRVRLSELQRLDENIGKDLIRRIGRKELQFMPQVMDNGWYCACGAFHPTEENTVYCSECGCDRILLQNTINAIIQPAPIARAALEEDPTVVVKTAPLSSVSDMQAEHTKMFSPTTDDTVKVYSAKKTTAENIQGFADTYQKDELHSEPKYDDDSYDDYDDEDYEDPRDYSAENIIRWFPPVTALLCAGIAFAGFSYCFFML